MATLIETLIQSAPIIVFFVQLMTIVIVLYVVSVLSEVLRKIAPFAAESHAIFTALFGEKELASLREADKILNDLREPARQLQGLAQKIRQTGEATKEPSQ